MQFFTIFIFSLNLINSIKCNIIVQLQTHQFRIGVCVFFPSVSHPPPKNELPCGKSNHNHHHYSINMLQIKYKYIYNEQELIEFVYARQYRLSDQLTYLLNEIIHSCTSVFSLNVYPFLNQHQRNYSFIKLFIYTYHLLRRFSVCSIHTYLIELTAQVMEMKKSYVIKNTGQIVTICIR